MVHRWWGEGKNSGKPVCPTLVMQTDMPEIIRTAGQLTGSLLERIPQVKLVDARSMCAQDI